MILCWYDIFLRAKLQQSIWNAKNIQRFLWQSVQMRFWHHGHCSCFQPTTSTLTGPVAQMSSGEISWTEQEHRKQHLSNNIQKKWGHTVLLSSSRKTMLRTPELSFGNTEAIFYLGKSYRFGSRKISSVLAGTRVIRCRNSHPWRPELSSAPPAALHQAGRTGPPESQQTDFQQTIFSAKVITFS